MRKLVWAVTACLLATVALGVSACGDDDDDDGGGGGSGKGGGELTIATVGPTTRTPCLFLTNQALQPYQMVYVPLLTYAHEEGAAGSELIPGLAEEIPEPTNNGKTYTFQLRDGLEVQRRHAGQGQRLREHDQAPRQAGQRLVVVLPRRSWASRSSRRRATSRTDIAGIEPNDQTGEITVNLTEPDTKLLSRDRAALRLADARGQVAGEEPQAAAAGRRPLHDRGHRLQRGVGPHAGTRTGPGSRGFPMGTSTRSRSNVSDSVPKMTQDVIRGDADFMTEDPTGDQLAEVREQYADRYSEAVTRSEHLLLLPERHACRRSTSRRRARR